MPYTTPHTITTGELVTVATMNNEWGGNVAFLANPPSCRVYRAAASSVANNTWESLPVFDTERWDTDNMHSTVTNSGRITFTTAGLYVVGGSVEFAPNATGLRGVRVKIGGGADIVTDHENSNGATFGTAVTVSTVYKFTAGQYIELQCFQNSGGALNVNYGGAGTAYSPEFWATWIGLG